MYEDVIREVRRAGREPNIACQDTVDETAEAFLTRLQKPFNLRQLKSAACHCHLAAKSVGIDNKATFDSRRRSKLANVAGWKK